MIATAVVVVMAIMGVSTATAVAALVKFVVVAG